MFVDQAGASESRFISAETIHPAVRVIIFLVFTLHCAFADVAGLLSAWIILLALYIIYDPASFRPALKMMRRMRWFFLSIAVIYFWFTPGHPVLAVDVIDVAWVPTFEGLSQGLARICALMLILLAVNLLIKSTSTEQLLVAIRWLVTPLSVLGLRPDRVAVRMTLILAALEEIQGLVSDHVSTVKGRDFSLGKIGNLSAQVFAEVVARAESAMCRPVSLSVIASAPIYQWLYPVFLFLSLALPMRLVLQ